MAPANPCLRQAIFFFLMTQLLCSTVVMLRSGGGSAEIAPKQESQLFAKRLQLVPQLFSSENGENINSQSNGEDEIRSGVS